MAKKTLRADKQKLFLVVCAVLLVAIGVGAYYIYQNNFAPTDSSAGESPVLPLRGSSISKLALAEGESFTVKCNYLATHKKTADGIYVIGEGITCGKGVAAKSTEPGNLTFTCTAETEGKYAVGCGIKPGTQVPTTRKECKTYGQGDSSTPNADGSCGGTGTYTDDEGVSHTGARPAVTVVGSAKVDYYSSSKVIDYITIGTPSGSNDCVVPVFIKGTTNPQNVSLTSKLSKTYTASCGYLLKADVPTTSVTFTADNATCGTTTKKGSQVPTSVTTISNRKYEHESKCTPKSGLVVGDTIETACELKSGTLSGVKICGTAEDLPIVTVVK